MLSNTEEQNGQTWKEKHYDPVKEQYKDMPIDEVEWNRDKIRKAAGLGNVSDEADDLLTTWNNYAELSALRDMWWADQNKPRFMW